MTGRTFRRMGCASLAGLLVGLAGAPVALGQNENELEEARRLRDERSRELINRMQAQRGDVQGEERPQPATAFGQPGGQPAEGGFDGEIPPGEDELRLDFDEPLDLSAFTDLVSRWLNVNIIEDPGLAGQRVLFRAPISIPRDDVMPLLRALVEDAGFALVYDDLGFYRVMPEAGINPNFEGGELSTTRVIPTPMVRPSSLQAIIQTQLGTGQGQAGTLRMTALDDHGVLMVTGPSKTLGLVESVVSRIVEEVADQKFTRFTLDNVSAVYARSRVIALNDRVATGGTVTPQNPAQTAAGASAGALGNLDSRLFVDQGNTLLFRGSDIEAERLDNLLAMVDVITPLTVKRYVAGSVALDAAQAGERLGLGPVTLASQSQGGTQPTLQRSGVPGQSGQQQQVEPASSSFLVDQETGSIIYYGTESQHERVDELVEEFKKTAIGENIEIRTFKLTFAKAEGDEDQETGVVDILTQLIEDPQRNTTRSPFIPQGGGGAQGPPDADLVAQLLQEAGEEAGEGTRLVATAENTIIVADPTRNQIIIKAPAKAMEQFAEIIEQLDQKQPQVLLKFQIVTVITSRNFNWEADVQLNFGQFSWFSGFGASILEGGDGAGTTLDPRTLPAQTPGLTTGIIKSDYLPVAIQTLETIGDTETLSEPQILVNDNAEASLESISEVPFTSSSQGANTTITSQGGVAEAGTILTVTPRISEGGDISIDYEVELSNFTGAASGGLQPPAQRDRYLSSVTVPSDSTIFVGGFKLDRDEVTENRIPILGEIPLLGNLFKSYNETEQEATIFVFITPRVMRDASGADLLLLTEGPLAAAGVDRDYPVLEPALMPIGGSIGPARERALPVNEAARSDMLSSAGGADDATLAVGN